MNCLRCAVTVPQHLAPFYFCSDTCCDKWWADKNNVKKMYSGIEGDFLDGSCCQYAVALELISGHPAVRFLGTCCQCHYAVKTPHGYLDAAGWLTEKRLAEQYNGLSLEDEMPCPEDARSQGFEDDTFALAYKQICGLGQSNDLVVSQQAPRCVYSKAA